MPNRLALETSPYLLQHRDNPVDWYPWGDDAFGRATTDDKPVFLSVGYAACHWCHVMERESFEDHDVAAFLNEHFVAIKVDREERPDIDAIYMEAVQALTGQGGWPMSVFLTPDGRPFYGGTYFPPTERYGMPSFRKLLEAIHDAWVNKRTDVTGQAAQLVDHIGSAARLEPSSEILSSDAVGAAVRAFESHFDAEWGGFGGAPKFPQPATIDLLLRRGARGDERALAMATRTLDAMSAGGMFDQLRGGFARYSVDRFWIVPHFEKMLYDNAQLIRTYARGWLVTGRSRYRDVVESTVDWMLDEMRDPGGGLWSSLDADSEGEEGKFYVWSLEEVKEIIGDDADAAVAHWGMSAAGNFEGRNIPVLADPDVDPDAVARARAALLARRTTRVRPATDDKVLTAWNGLAASALTEAGILMERREWVDTAAEVMGFVLDKLRVGGRLMRSYKKAPDGGDVRHLGYAEDYAFSLEAALALFEATGEASWLDTARWLADEALRLFEDGERGGFFTTGSDAPALVTRSKDIIDDAVPSANSVLALELLRLGLITSDARYEESAVRAIRLVRDAMLRSPSALAHALAALDLYTGDPLEIVILGEPGSPGRDELLDALRSSYLPNKVVVLGGGAAQNLPLLAGRTLVDGKATAYVCRRGSCRLPVTDAKALLAEIRAA